MPKDTVVEEVKPEEEPKAPEPEVLREVAIFGVQPKPVTGTGRGGYGYKK